MRFQELFGRTLREAPADAELTSHRLALRAGLIRPLGGGIYAWLPLGLWVLRRVEAIVRAELAALNGQEMLLPGLLPVELLQESGRWQPGLNEVLLKCQNRDGRHYVLAADFQEALAAMMAHEIESYRDLPRLVYQIRSQYQDIARPRGGLIGLREFTVAEAYSLGRTPAELDTAYDRVLAAWQRVFARVGLHPLLVEAPGGHEFAILHPQGEEAVARCDRCGYTARVEIAQARLPAGPSGTPEVLAKVSTPDCKTIEDVAHFLGVETHQTLKAVFFIRDETELVFVLLRGDLEVSEAKLIQALGGGTLRAATEAEIRAVGAEPGYASPVGLAVRTTDQPDGVTVVADISVQAGVNFVAGANEAGFHLTGVNYPRDFVVTLLADIAAVADGATCGQCGAGALHVEQAIVVGYCRKPAGRLSERLGVRFLTEGGQAQPVLMGYYGLMLERLIAAIIEAHHDAAGIVWPRSVAPFAVEIVTLGKEPLYHEQGRALYAELKRAGLNVLLDDRDERPGVKFADADLVGAPLRVTVSQRALERDVLEGKWRHSEERFDIPVVGAAAAIVRLVGGE
ncbi:MAG: proline--tRNA ligase [Anaerolineae bacterium]|nr:proline--tRNA ligase [Anaerolineae bacterium]